MLLDRQEQFAVADTDPQIILREFISKYDALVDLLCWSAKEGVNAERIQSYISLRAWFVRHYCIVSPIISSQINVIDADLQPAVSAGPPSRDTFEALFLPVELGAQIESLAVIDRITRTRPIIESYRLQFGM